MSLREQWDTITHTNIYKIGVPEKEERRAEKMLEEIMTPNLPNVVKYMKLHSQEAQWTPGEINAEIHTKTHTSQIVKRKTKAAKEKRLVTYKKSSIRLTADFSLDRNVRRR